MRWTRWAAGLGLVISVSVPAGRAGGAAQVEQTSLQVAGRELVATADLPVLLAGVNRAGTEYACAQGWGIFDGPSTAASIAAIRAFGADTIRVPLNEDCWLGVNVPPTFSGAVYRRAITRYVRTIEAGGMAVVLDLHWGAPGYAPALGQEAMPDAGHAVPFWHSVATTFGGDPRVLYELFNEPHDVTWRCWDLGCTMPGGWRAAGMQQLVDTIRATGAPQPIIADGLAWGNDLTGFLGHRPVDPLHRLVAGFHVYPWSGCSSVTCWDRQVAPVAAAVPVVTTEVGTRACNGAFASTYLSWAGAHHISSIAWVWDTNEGCYDLVHDYAGAPTAYGSAVRAGLLRLRGQSAALPSGPVPAAPAAPAGPAPPSPGAPAAGAG
ncbi:MAG: cellulase family glycosylhydrolase [Actinomycetota bacterium]|nr:cellulase family glycosylhydrolase [Actinomycetota bacterium]